jgi:pSer/pThr/pTyr-binding forkhead associated (FHA) protein
VVLGRSPDCDIALSQGSVSRHHARLRRTREGWDVLDLGSTNGTWLNGRLVSSAVAQPGDVLSLADHPVVVPGL